jgi:hypothetical protein
MDSNIANGQSLNPSATGKVPTSLPLRGFRSNGVTTNRSLLPQNFLATTNRLAVFSFCTANNSFGIL